MRKLVEDLLDVASLDAGRLTVRPEPCEAADLVRQAAAQVEPQTQGKSLRLRVLPTPWRRPKPAGDGGR